MEKLLSQRVTPTKLEHAANMLKVIAHPVRLSIVDLLNVHGSLTVLEIQNSLGLEQAIASQHLILMQDKGVLKSEKIGRNRYFSLTFPNMKNIIHCMEDCCNQKPKR
jgi:DNA-binding transcriptional ArsR family regulator